MLVLTEIKRHIPKALVFLAGIAWAGFISSTFFALTHTQYDSWGWLSVGTMGMIACYMTYRTGSLKSSMAMHALGNLMITLDVYFHYQLPL